MMNKKINSNLTLLKFILRAQEVAKQDAGIVPAANSRSDKGYGMIMTSIISIMMFSLLGAYLTMSNLDKASTNAYIDGSNTFYAAESGLNKRAQELREKFEGYSTPSGLSPGQATTSSVVTPANIANCFSLGVTTNNTSNDFECRNYPFRYSNSTATVKSANSNKDGGWGGGTEVGEKNSNTDYNAYTFVADRTTYSTTSTPAAPIPQRIPAGQTYAGLNAQEYKYTVYSTAAKPDPTNSAQPVRLNDTKAILQMDFKSRVIPLFQFAAFYNRDLEMNSTSQMIVRGWVHTNANLYIQPTPLNTTDPGTDFLRNITAAGDIYNRVDASTITRSGIARVLMTGTTYQSLPNYNSSRITPLTDAEISPFSNKVLNGTGGATVLNPPDAGFMRKRNYYTNKIGDYFAKADLRLEMVPDRVVPFNFTAIQSGTNAIGGNCTTTLPTAGSDPAWNYISSSRQGSNFKCSQLTEGQLQSLQQPVLVLTRDNMEERDRFCDTTNGIVDRTKSILDDDNVVANSTVAGLTTAQKDKVLRALQIAISSTRTSIDYSNVVRTGTLPTAVQDTFGTLLGNTTLNIGLTTNQINSIKVAAPASIAKTRNSCFLPAPIQMVKKNQTDTRGFFDRRENRWLTMAQTNLESLTIWNRDGKYVNLNGNLNDIDTATTTALTDALNSGNPSNPNDSLKPDFYSSNNLLFTRKAADSTKAVGSFDKLGLSAADTTEGGLVFHATVSDDLNGDGTIVAANDVTKDTSNPVYKLNPDNTRAKDSSGNDIIMDYLRLYKGGSSRQSPYGFAFNGGRNLPGALTVVSDRGVYLQGDYNSYQDTQATPVSAKKSASILADTITVLSVNCLSPGTTTDPSTVFTGQINCGIAATLSGTDPWTGTTVRTSTSNAMYDADDTTVNAAFLSYTDSSTGNLGTGRGYGGTQLFSGGLNNYMRMVEDWSNQNFNYSGSFISLGSPLEFSGAYQSGGGSTSYYGIPIRNFAYETDFDSFDKLPPLTPAAIYLQQSVFKRN